MKCFTIHQLIGRKIKHLLKKNLTIVHQLEENFYYTSTHTSIKTFIL